MCVAGGRRENVETIFYNCLGNPSRVYCLLLKKQQDDVKSLQGALQITNFLQTAQQIVVMEGETDKYTAHWSYTCLSFLISFYKYKYLIFFNFHEHFNKRTSLKLCSKGTWGFKGICH